MSTHTPGPWAVYPNPMRDDGVFVGTAEHKVEHIPRLGYVEDRPRPTKMICASQVDPADGRLIAAAPDLLAACKDCLENRGDWSAQMFAAIAKAEPTPKGARNLAQDGEGGGTLGTERGTQ